MSQRSLLKRYSIKAQLAFTNTKATSEPTDIINAKSNLKSTKNLTAEMEIIANALYAAQESQARALNLLCDRLRTAPTHNPDDKFSIFVNNMGRVWSNFEEINQMYLINMKDQFIDPLHQFNKEVIPKCQKSKLKLKTIKGKYDMKKKTENKILESQRYKNINLQKMHKARSKTTVQLDELQVTRNQFKSAIQNMQLEKLNLLCSIQQYMDSYKAYADIHSTNLQIQTKMMMKHQRVPTQYTGLHNIVKSLQLDSNNNTNGIQSIHYDAKNQTKLAFNDWGKRSTVVKEGYFKKRGQVNKGFKRRWFKLFANKKLTYFTHNGPNGILKGHVNLTSILTMNKPGPVTGTYIDIRTVERMWRFQFESIEDRDSWYNVIQQICVEGKGVTFTETANNFGDMFKKDVETPMDDIEQKHVQQEFEVNKSAVLSDFVSINIEFQVTVNNIKIYSDKELIHEVFCVELARDSVVEGQYINSKVILLAKLKFYIAAKDVDEVVMGVRVKEQFYTQNYKIEDEISAVNPADFVAIKSKFRVMVDNIEMYMDKDMMYKDQGEPCLPKNSVVDGQYMDSKIIFVDTLNCYIVATDVEDEYM